MSAGARTDGPRVLLVGAGPAGLAVATALRCHGLGDEVEVVDPTGGWMVRWHERFAAQDIPHLRSPAVHHPHPDPFALLAGCAPQELVRAGGTSLPTTAAFHRFCRGLVAEQRLDDAVAPLAVTRLEPDVDGTVTVGLCDGSRRRPGRVVLATNRRVVRRPAAVPDAAARDPRVAVGDDADVADTPAGGHIVVVGGGLSAAHLAIGAAHRGATVTLLSRRRLQVRRFDTHPSWLGPKRRRPFESEPDPTVRRRQIDHARGGGTIPHGTRRRLDACVAGGQVTLRERVQLTDVDGRRSRLRVTCDDGSRLDADRLWLATGGVVDVAADPLLAGLSTTAGPTIAGGLPDLEPDLRWPGTTLHLVGAAASLVLGPTAGNLVGHRRGASRVSAAVRGVDPAAADRIATGAGACPATPRRRLAQASSR